MAMLQAHGFPGGKEGTVSPTLERKELGVPEVREGGCWGQVKEKVQ